MKKRAIKLSLSRETLGLLSLQESAKVLGGSVRSVGAGSCVRCTDNTCLTCVTCLTCKYSCPGQTCTCPI